MSAMGLLRQLRAPVEITKAGDRHHGPSYERGARLSIGHSRLSAFSGDTSAKARLRNSNRPKAWPLPVVLADSSRNPHPFLLGAGPRTACVLDHAVAL